MTRVALAASVVGPPRVPPLGNGTRYRDSDPVRKWCEDSQRRGLPNAAESGAIVIGTARAELVSAERLVESVERVLIEEPRVGLIVREDQRDLLVDFRPLFGIAFQHACLEQLVHFGVGVAA